MNDLILEFVETGNLRGLKIGLSVNEVLNLLNVSIENIFSVTNRRTGYEQGDLMLSFFKGKLDIISIKVKEENIYLPSPIAHEVIKIANKKFNEIKEYLTAEQIEVEIYEPETREDMICLKTKSGVLIYFNDLHLSEIVVMQK